MLKNFKVEIKIPIRTYNVVGEIASGIIFFAIVCFSFYEEITGLLPLLNGTPGHSVVLVISSVAAAVVITYIVGSSLQKMSRFRGLECRALRMTKGKEALFKLEDMEIERQKRLSFLDMIGAVNSDIHSSISKIKIRIKVAGSIFAAMLIVFLFMFSLELYQLSVPPLFFYIKAISILVLAFVSRLMVKRLWYVYYSDISGTYLLFQMQMAHDKDSQ